MFVVILKRLMLSLPTLAGIVLVVAMIITPAAAARLLGGRIGRVTAVAAIIGAATAAVGTLASRAVPGVPTGAAMTLAATAALLVAVPLGHLAKAARA